MEREEDSKRAMNIHVLGSESEGQRPAGVPVSVLLLLAGAAIMSAAAFVPVSFLRAVVVLPIALVIPGYAVLTAVFRDKRTLAVEELALSIIVSMAIYPLLALILYLLSIQLTTVSVVVAVDVLVAVLVSLSVLRHDREQLMPPWDQLHGVMAGGGWRAQLRPLLLIAGAFAIVAAAIGLAFSLAPRKTAAPYTQFYLARSWAKLTTPVRVQPGTPLSVSVAIGNHTEGTQTYRVAPVVDGTSSWKELRVTVPAAGTWVGTVRGTVPSTGCIHHLAIQLYQSRDRHPRYQLSVWTSAHPTSSSSCVAK
jgi:uncharacterized membrane protein